MQTETASGRGRIWHDGKIALEAAGYTIAIGVEPHHPPHGLTPELPGPPLSGRLTCSFPSWLLGRPVELELEDGRRWRCELRAINGHMIDRGGLYRVPEVSPAGAGIRRA